jgi:hypothetical protein
MAESAFKSQVLLWQKEYQILALSRVLLSLKE